MNELYCKDRRDAIIIFCIDRGYSLRRVDDELYRLGGAHAGGDSAWPTGGAPLARAVC